MYHSRSSGDGWAGLVGLILLVAIVALTICVYLCLEIGKIFLDRAVGQTTRAAKILWGSLATWLATIGLLTWVASTPAALALGTLTVGVWVTALLLLVCVVVEWVERRREQPAPLQLAAPPTLDDVLGDWVFPVSSSAAPSIR